MISSGGVVVDYPDVEAEAGAAGSGWKREIADSSVRNAGGHIASERRVLYVHQATACPWSNVGARVGE